jgi:hypothetical protein
VEYTDQPKCAHLRVCPINRDFSVRYSVSELMSIQAGRALGGTGAFTRRVEPWIRMPFRASNRGCEALFARHIPVIYWVIAPCAETVRDSKAGRAARAEHTRTAQMSRQIDSLRIAANQPGWTERYTKFSSDRPTSPPSHTTVVPEDYGDESAVGGASMAAARPSG